MPAVFEAADDDVQVASKVRTFVAAEVRALGREDLVDDAVLVASELATNAVLHAGGVSAIDVRPTEGGVRVLVSDGSRVLPLLGRASGDTMTGRGLRLVAALASRWSVEMTATGKVVWADVTGAPVAGTIDERELFQLYGDDQWGASSPAPARTTVSLGDVPTPLLLAAKSHVDNLVREFTLAANGAETGVTAAVPSPLAALIDAVVSRFAEARQEIKRQAMAAAGRGLSHVRLELSLPVEAADAGEDYLRALDEIDAYCRAARLLTLETPPQHRVFRHWYVGELVAQLRAAAGLVPRRPPQSFEDRLLLEIDNLAKAQAASERAARLLEVMAGLAAAATPEAVAAAVVEHGVAALGASGGGVLLATETGRLAVPGAVGYDEEVVAGLRGESSEAELPSAVALRTGEPVWLESREERDRRFPGLATLERGTVSVCAVPLTVGNRRLGALRFSFPQARLFGDDERRFILALAAETAQALDRAQLYEQRLELSRRLQRSLLPARLVAPALIDIAAVYHPLGDGMELGGDMYDFWPVHDGRWALAISDAAGTGPEAAALTAMVRFTLRALSVIDLDPASVVAKLNRALLDAETSGFEGERFCTTLFGVLSPGLPSTIALAGGGHPPPILRRAGGQVEELPVGGTLLGVLEGTSVAGRSLTLEPGDALVLYTDGVIEARRAGVMFGTERLLEAVASAPEGAAGIAAGIEDAVLDHAGGVITDDLAALVLRVAP